MNAIASERLATVGERREARNDLPAAAPAESLAGRALRILIPVVMLLLLLIAWQAYVTIAETLHYILPSPTRIAQALAEDWATLLGSLWVTLKITFSALAIAVFGG